MEVGKLEGQTRILIEKSYCETHALIACPRCGKKARVKCAGKKAASTASGSLELMCMPTDYSVESSRSS